MNIIALLKKLIKNSNNNIDIIPLNSLFPLPTRENYINNPDMLNLIDKVKKEYLVKINSKRFITSLDINNKELINNMLMYLDIILNNILNYDDKIEKISLEDKINYLIKTRKLILYLKTIKNESFKVTANLIALQEILLSHKFISKNKKATLKNEINNLSNILITYLVKEKALILETSSYLDKYSYKLEENEENKKEKIIEIKKDKLIEYAKIILNKNIALSNNLMDLAIIEKELEEWVYKHKEEGQSLKKRLDNICTLEFSFNNKDTLMKLIEPLEIKYWLFYEYGKDLISKEDLKDFYQIKFNVLILSLNGISEVIINKKTNDFEFLCYSNIINKKIEDLVKGNGELNKSSEIDVILNILKSSPDIIDTKAILKSKYLFNLCLTMNSKQALINFLKNFKINYTKYYNLDIIRELHSFYFEEELPLETIYRIMLALNYQYDARLYEILQKDIYPDKDYYYLPEGLKEIINLPSSSKFLTKEENLIINKILNLSRDKNIVFPHSFKKLNKGTYLFEATLKRCFIIDNIKIPFNNDFVINKNDGNIITYYNTTTKETVTHNKRAFIQNKWGDFPAYGILKFIPDRNMYIERYYDNFYSFNHLLNRSYIDITTKYGNYCLCIEENYTKICDSPNISISLYYGHHNEIIDNLTNDFDLQKYLIYRNKIVYHRCFEEWIVGSSKYNYRHIWNYNRAIYEGKEIDSSIYAFQSSNGNFGFIFDGRLKISENKKYLPDLLYEDTIFEEFEQNSLGLKACFGNYKECLFIFKNENGYLEFIIKKYIKGKWVKEEMKVKASKGWIITITDDEDIIKKNITKFNFNKDLEKYIIEEFTTFISNRYSLDGLFKILNTSTFDSLTSSLTKYKSKSDTNKQIEALIESISHNFHISLEELIEKEEKGVELKRKK